MNRFITKEILKPFTTHWLKGIILLLLWAIAFVALPAISAWFLASCSLAFIVANRAFSYLIPSAIIRLIALGRTATRYFEKLENHKTTLKVQHRLQLKIFKSVSKFSYLRKQADNNSNLLENSTHGIELILNHILLWFLPLISATVVLILLTGYIVNLSTVIGLLFFVSSATILFIVPQLLFHRNKILYETLKSQYEENQQTLIESFRGRIEISKYNLQQKAIEQYNLKLAETEHTERKIETNSYYLQLVVGLGLSIVGIFVLWFSNSYNISAEIAIGVFFGIMAQAELAEMMFSGKSERNSVKLRIKQIEQIFDDAKLEKDIAPITENLQKLSINNWQAKVPETDIITNNISFEINKGEWIAIFGDTGKGKTTLLNSLFYPEYQKNGTLNWNNKPITQFTQPKCIYVTQKAYLLTGTLRENFQEYSDSEILDVLQIVDLHGWYKTLSQGLNTWIGENGETLSGGQRKKLLLAQALLKNPELLVIDEPTAGIDSQNAIEIFNTIRKEFPDMAVLMATHLLELKEFADSSVHL